MANTRVGSAETTSMNDIDQTTETTTDFRRTVDSEQQDFPGTRYYNSKYSTWFGYYKNVPELQAVINKKAMWTVGKGFEADARTTRLLEKIKGNGKDTFNFIIDNIVKTYTINGDSYAEIVKTKRGELRNLKPINAGTMVTLSNAQGIITGYEQHAVYGGKKKIIKFSPDNIFHLQWNRLGDEPHGRSTIEKLIDIIDSNKEAMKDLRIVFHRYVKPLIISQIDSDDETEILNYKTKLDNAVKNMENLVIPKDTVEMERMSIPQFSTLDPLPWIRQLQQYFILAEGVPEVILGWGKDTTEASSKILYLAWQQTVEYNQQFLEEQLKAQLDIKVEFNFPADLMEHMEDDMRKEGNVTLKGDKNSGKKAGKE